MPNTLISVFVTNPATEPAEAPHPNTGVYVTGTQATVGGPWTVVHTLVTKTATPLTMVGRLKNFPTITVSVVASGGPSAGNIFNNILAQPTGTSATPTSSTALSVVVSSIANQTGYRLLASDTQTGTYTQIYQSTTASYPHTGLTAGQTKWYKWQYVGGGFYDDSPLSAAFSGITSAAASATAPVLNNLLPNSAIIGNNIQISGTNLAPGATVAFGAIAATVVSSSATSLTVTVPAGTTNCNVIVTTPQGASNPLFFSLPTAAGTVPVNILAVGNSIVEGTQGYRFTDKIISLMPTSWVITNRGHGGWGISLMIKNATAATRAANGGPTQAGLDVSAYTADVEPYYNASAVRNILLVQEGSNEIVNYDTLVRAYIAARQSEGWEVILASSAIRTDIDTNWLTYTKAENAVIRGTAFPGVYGKRFVDFERCPKLTRYGDITILTDTVHSSNNPAWNYDKVHWTQLTHQAAGQLYWDYINNLVNGIALPADVTAYPTSVPLPGIPMSYVLTANAQLVGTAISPVGTTTAQFSAGATANESLVPLASGFIGAFQVTTDSNQPGLYGFGSLNPAIPSFNGIQYGFNASTIWGGGAGAPTFNAVGGDIMRVELYADKVIWLRNGSPLFTLATPVTTAMKWGITLNGTQYSGIHDGRIEGNLFVAATLPGEAMVLTSISGGAVVDASGVLTAPTAAQFGGRALSTKHFIAGTGLLGFVQATTDNGTDSGGSFFGFAPSAGDYTTMPYAFFIVGGNLIIVESNVNKGTVGTVSAASKIKIEVYGADASNAAMPNGGAIYYKDGVVLYTSTTAPTLPLFADFAVSNTVRLSSLRLGGPGLTV